MAHDVDRPQPRTHLAKLLTPDAIKAEVDRVLGPPLAKLKAQVREEAERLTVMKADLAAMRERRRGRFGTAAQDGRAAAAEAARPSRAVSTRCRVDQRPRAAASL